MANSQVMLSSAGLDVHLVDTALQKCASVRTVRTEEVGKFARLQSSFNYLFVLHFGTLNAFKEILIHFWKENRLRKIY